MAIFLFEKYKHQITKIIGLQNCFGEKTGAPKFSGAMFWIFWASPGPGVAVAGRASSRNANFQNSRRNPCSEKAFRCLFFVLN